MPDDYGQMNQLSTVGTGPTLQPPQQAPATPGWQQTLQQILPAVIPALGAFLTSSKWAGPGAAVGRGLLAGYMGEELARAGPSEKDRYYEELIKDHEAKRKQLEQTQKSREQLLGELPEDQRALAQANPDDFNKIIMANRTRESNVDLLTKQGGYDPKLLASQDPQTIAKWASMYMDADVKNASKPIIRKEVVNGELRDVMVDPRNMQIRAVGGLTKMPGEGGGKDVLIKEPGQPLMVYHPGSKTTEYIPDPTGAEVTHTTGEKMAGTQPSKTYVDERGNPLPTEKIGLPDTEVVKQGYRAIGSVDARSISTGRQALTMLKNTADTFDTLNAKGKMVGRTGLGALWDRANLKWKEVSADPDLRLAQAQTSDLVALMRNLGDKGVRAMQAFQGAMDLMTTGRAPYSTVKTYFQQIDSALRAGAPIAVPKAYDDFPGAREMGTPKKSPSGIDMPEGWSVQRVE